MIDAALPPMGHDDPSVEEMAGQMVLGGFAGVKAPPPRLVTLLEERALGGVVLFGRNVSDPASARALTDAIRGCCDPLLPPMVAVDQEGGKVQRFKAAPFTRLPPVRSLGLSGDPGLAYKWGKVLATELRQVGVNFNLAPVMDVDTNPDNPIIGDRALGATAEGVATLGMAMALGMQQEGMGACAKHFPGHGDAHVDSHEDLPVLKLASRRLNSVELRPFKRAAKGEVASIMAGHLRVPKLDPELPATLSKKMIDGIIRQTWKYDGLVVTDDMEMGAIAKHFDFEKAVTLGVEAGVDLFLVCSDLDKVEAAVHRLVAWGRRGAARRDRMRQSYRRIMAFKSQYCGPPPEFAAAEIGQAHHRRLVEVVMERASATAGE